MRSRKARPAPPWYLTKNWWPVIVDPATKSCWTSWSAGDGKSSLDLARVYAVSAAAAMKDDTLQPSDRTRLADDYARKSIDLLQCAAKSGHLDKPEDANEVATSADFASLQDRDVFRSLLDKLRGKQP